MGELGSYLKRFCHLMGVLLLGVVLSVTLAGTGLGSGTKFAFVGGDLHLECIVQSSNISWFHDEVRLDNDDPNVVFESERWLGIISITIEWNNTVLQCVGVSSSGRAVPGSRNLVIVYDPLVAQQPVVDVSNGSANITWKYPWSHLSSSLNCSVAIYNETANSSLVYTETTASEALVVTEQEVVNCLACGSCFVNLTIEKRSKGIIGPPHRLQRRSETTAVSVPHVSRPNISVQEVFVIISFYIVPAVCGATPSWVKHANTGTPLPLTSYVAEVMAVNSSASIFTLLINGSTIDTMASYVMRLWMVWNGNRNALVPINISPEPRVVPSEDSNNTISGSTDVAAIVSPLAIVLVLVVLAVMVLPAVVKKIWFSPKKEYDPNRSTAKLRPSISALSLDIEGGAGSFLKIEVTTGESASQGPPPDTACTVSEETDITSPPESTEPRNRPDIESVEACATSKVERSREECSTEGMQSEVALTPEPHDPAGVETVQNFGSNSISVRAEVTPGESSSPSEVTSTPPESDSSTSTVSEEAEVTPVESSLKDLPSEVTFTPPESSSSTSTVEAEVTPVESSSKDLPSVIISTPPESSSSTSTVTEEAEVTPVESSSKDLPSEVTSTPPESSSSTSTVEAEVTPVESSSKDLPSVIISTPPESSSSTSTVSEEAEVTPVESSSKDLPSEVTSTPPESSSSTSTVTEEAEVTPVESSSKDLPSEVTSTPPESSSSTSTVEAEVTPVESSSKDLPSVIISTPPESDSVLEEAEASPQGYSCLLSKVASTEGVQEAGFTSAPTPELTDDEGYMIPESELFEAAIAVVNDQDHPKKEDGQYTGTDPQDATPTSSLGRRQPPAQQQHRGDVEITTDGVGIQSEPKQFPNKYDDPDLP